jgi:arylsulfatase A-like enzyme
MSRINRRDFLHLVGLAAGGSISFDSHNVNAQSHADHPQSLEPGARPNILLIYSDQHRYDCLGLAGHPDVKTPNIDALAKNGIWYQNSFCCSNVCTPSRYSLLTGLYVHQHGGRGNRSTLPRGIPAFPQLLRDTGYRTTAVGKMHFTPTYLDVGFDKMVLAEQGGAGRYVDDYHAWLMEHDLIDELDTIEQVAEHRQRAPTDYWDSFGAQISNLDEKYHSTTWIGEQALDEISNWDRSKPSLLMAGFIKPHHPFDPPAQWANSYVPSALELPAGWTDEPLARDMAGSDPFFPMEKLTEQRFRKVLAYYYALISQVDYQVGRMVKLLLEKGLYDNTMIIYTSDHGEYLGYHHMLLKDGPLYDPIVKVPLVIKFPEGIRAGETHVGQVNSLDITATILAAAFAEYPVNPLMPVELPGGDLRSATIDHEVIFAERWEATLRKVMSGEFAKVIGSGGGLTSFMARTPEHKLLLDRRSVNTQFFDLGVDPYEMINLNQDDQYRQIREELRERIFDWLTFANPLPMYTDSGAQQITGIHENRFETGHVKRVKEYFRQKIQHRLIRGIDSDNT